MTDEESEGLRLMPTGDAHGKLGIINNKLPDDVRINEICDSILSVLITSLAPPAASLSSLGEAIARYSCIPAEYEIACGSRPDPGMVLLLDCLSASTRSLCPYHYFHDLFSVNTHKISFSVEPAEARLARYQGQAEAGVNFQ